MSWSWRIAKIAGIDLYIHFTFVFLLAWVGLQYYSAHGRIGEAVTGLIFIIALFAIVVMHELGHALAARRYGIKTRDITLLPIGGVARLERMPEDPRQELVVALAGPAVNVVLAASIFLGSALRNGLTPIDDAVHVGASVVHQLFWVNVVLAVFNLLPAFPMDGGRVLRALLAFRMDYARATQTAAYVGQGMAVLFGIVGLFASPMNPLLILVAVFVWMGAAQEAGAVSLRSTLGNIPVARAMISQFQLLDPREPLSRAIEYLIAGFQHDFPVVDNHQVVGVLTRDDLGKAVRAHGPEIAVGEVMRRDFVVADPLETLQTALSKLQQKGCHTILVVQDSRLVGLVTKDNLAEVFMIERALREREPGAFLKARRVPQSSMSMSPFAPRDRAT